MFFIKDGLIDIYLNIFNNYNLKQNEWNKFYLKV